MKKFTSSLLLAILAFSFCPLWAQEAFVRHSVVEEFTGTWCGNCPRGIVGMQRLSEDFGDQFIGIAIHTGLGDPMLIPTYPDVQADLLPGSGAPCCAIDRIKFKFDPYSGSGQRGYHHYGIDQDFAAALAMPTEAKVELTAEWDDEYQWDVRFNVTTTFNIDSPTAPYRLILILTEDGLTGTSDSWQQTNYYSLDYEASAGTDYVDDDMKAWREAPYQVENVVYDHVAVNTMGIKSGIARSISAPIVAWQPQTYTSTLTTLASHTQRLIQDKSRLGAVVMLINTETGQVVNAAKAPIAPFGQSGIKELQPEQPSYDLPSTSSPLPYQKTYDMQGRQQHSTLNNQHPTQKGIYIKNGKKQLR